MHVVPKKKVQPSRVLKKKAKKVKKVNPFVRFLNTLLSLSVLAVFAVFVQPVAYNSLIKQVLSIITGLPRA